MFLDIIEEVTTELTVPDEKELFNFATYNTKIEKQDEDLWSPKKLTPYLTLQSDDSYVQPQYTGTKPTETFQMTVSSVRILFEMEHSVRLPVIMVKVRFWSHIRSCELKLVRLGRLKAVNSLLIMYES